MADYLDFIELANELLDEFGMPITYLAVSEYGKVDPDTGKKPVKIESFEVIGVKTSPTKEELDRGQFKGVTMVVLVAGDKLNNPDTTDVIQFDGHDYDITEIVKVAPAQDNILYKFGVTDAGLVGTSTRIRGRS